ncbi:hypothetical protein D3C87_2076480 [compost metagenome]
MPVLPSVRNLCDGWAEGGHAIGLGFLHRLQRAEDVLRLRWGTSLLRQNRVALHRVWLRSLLALEQG